MVLLSRYNSVLANDRLRAAEGGLRGSPPQISLLDLEHQIKCIAKFYILNHVCHILRCLPIKCRKVSLDLDLHHSTR
jgi:hypothetical protein